MDKNIFKKQQKKLRQARSRAKVLGTNHRPRISVKRSLNHIYAQIIDDEQGKTILSFSDHNLDKKNKNKVDVAFQVGENLAKIALDKKIKTCVFDKSGYRYHGRIKSLAEGLRQGGLKF